MQYIHVLNGCNTNIFLIFYVVGNDVFCTYSYTIYVLYVINDRKITLEGFTSTGEAKHDG